MTVSTLNAFISHHHDDEGIARLIANDLSDCGAATFLAEQNLSPGQSIHDGIGNRLRWCDHLVLLLSQKSLTSPWVFVELGAAWARGKRIVPITVNFNPKEAPAFLSGLQCIDLKDIGVYYEEIRRYGLPTYAVGDHVRVPDSPRPAVTRLGDLAKITWNPDQSEYCGKEARITRVKREGVEAFEIDLDNGRNWWPFEWFADQQKPPSSRNFRKAS
jgi:hypothetical protein